MGRPKLGRENKIEKIGVKKYLGDALLGRALLKGLSVSDYIEGLLAKDSAQMLLNEEAAKAEIGDALHNWSAIEAAWTKHQRNRARKKLPEHFEPIFGSNIDEMAVKVATLCTVLFPSRHVQKQSDLMMVIAFCIARSIFDLFELRWCMMQWMERPSRSSGPT